MPMNPTQLFPLALGLGLLAGCSSERPGTQIGVEDSLMCEVLSTEVLTDLDAVPDGFSASPQDLLDGVLGAFSGDQLDEEEQPNGATARVTVSDPGEAVNLVRYEVVAETDGGNTDDLSHLCPPVLLVDLSFTLEAEGLPDFAALLETRISAEGESWAESEEEGHFASALPAPTTFDPDDFDTVYPRTVFSGAGGAWWTYVSWLAYNTSEVESDGDVPTTDELLLMASLTAE